MLVAQSLLEYARGTNFGGAMQALWVAFVEWISDVSQTSWLEAGVFVILLVLYWNRRSTRTRK
jgi:hypothetical protein